MPEQRKPQNPYIAGKALSQDRGFFGRENILHMVETVLASPDQNAIVLFGQRRVGKTSILLQMQRRLPSLPFLPVYFDMMERVQRPLGRMLSELASTIVTEIGLTPEGSNYFDLNRFDDEGMYFRREFLPRIY